MLDLLNPLKKKSFPPILPLTPLQKKRKTLCGTSIFLPSLATIRVDFESSIYKCDLIPKKKGFGNFLVKNVKFKREKVWNIVLKPSFIDQLEEEKSMHTFSLDLIIVLVFNF